MASTDLALSGLASGFDWLSVVDKLTEVERAPQNRLRTEQSLLGLRNTAYGNIVTEMLALKDKADALNESALYTSRKAAVGDDTILSASAAAGTASREYTFDIT